jgi:phosphatidate phosphatase APP1
MMRAALLIVPVAAILSFPTLAHAWSSLEKWFEGAEETLVVFPTYATIDDGGDLVVPVRAWVYEPEPESASRQLFVRFLQQTLDMETDEQRERFEERIWPFLADNERGKTIEMEVGGKSFPVGETAPNGHTTNRIRIPAEVAADAVRDGEQERWIEPTFRAESGEEQLQIPVVEREGLSVVSDIDDTVKVTEVLDRGAMLERTFLEEFEAVEGMAERYRGLEEERDPAFHYLSASPWQLLPFLESFLADEGFPPGVFHLRQLRPRSISSPADFASGSSEYKTATIERLIEDFPGRHFILIGDSSEHDPEVYGGIARSYPESIAHVAIRAVAGADNFDARFAEALEGVPERKWETFENANDLQLR